MFLARFPSRSRKERVLSDVNICNLLFQPRLVFLLPKKGKDSRTSHMWVAVKDSNWLGKASWEVPVARVISGMEHLDQVHEVGDMAPWGKGPDTGKIVHDKTFATDFPGKYLKASYPGIDYWKRCSLLPTQ